MKRIENRLSALDVRRLTKPGYHCDGAGLYLRIAEGRRLWVFRYQTGGKSRWMSLGPTRDVTLAEARETAKACRRKLRDGIDPISSRQSERALASREAARTFEIMVGEYLQTHRAAWRNAKHADQWASSLRMYAFPVVGSKQVNVIDLEDVLKILKPIWWDKTETASRVRGRLEAVLNYAKVRGWFKAENPARWKGHLDQLLPARGKIAQVQHHAALPWSEIPTLWKQLSTISSVSSLCLRFLILTVLRSHEVRGARWQEIDFSTASWTVPADRMKAKRPHRVPLSPEAIEILGAVSGLRTSDESLIFPGGRPGSVLSDVALSKTLHHASDFGVTVHGMRSSFRDWAAERTNYPGEIAETSLAHINKNRVEAAYLRGDHFEKRRQLMGAWSRHVVSLIGQP